MPRESSQTKLSRTRAPRVQISYQVTVGGAIKLKEIPFVMGVLGDFTGHPSGDAKPLRERRFVDLVPEKFDDVLASMKPNVQFLSPNKLMPKLVNNQLTDDPKLPQVPVNLHFEKLEDFEPMQVALKVGPLKELLELRSVLSDLRGSLQTNQKLNDVLQEVVSNTEKLDELKRQFEESKAMKAAALKAEESKSEGGGGND